MRWGRIAWLALLAGCVPYVNLRAPSPRASGEERLQAYQRLRPLGLPETNAHGEVDRAVDERQEGNLPLAGGQTVGHASDLLPLVPVGSDTARAAARSSDLQAATYVFGAIGIAAILVAAVFEADSHQFGDGASDGFFASMATSAVLTGVVALTATEARRASEVAYGTYERDLRARLALCSASGLVFPCEAAPAPRVAATP
jgi:hypothetical protein